MKGIFYLIFPVVISFLVGCSMIEPEWFAFMQKSRNACAEGNFKLTEEYLQKATSSYGPEKYPDYGPGPGFPIGFSGQLASLADCYAWWGKFDRAESLFKQAIALKPDGGYEAGLGKMYRQQGKNTEAEQCFQKMVLMLKKTYKPKNDDTFHFLGLDVALFDLGDCYYSEGKLVQAESEYEQGLQVLQESSMRSPGFLEYRLMSVGNFYLSQRNIPKAKSCFQRVVAIEEQLPKIESNYLDKASNSLAKIAAAETDSKLAEMMYAQALKDVRKEAFKKIKKEETYIQTIY